VFPLHPAAARPNRIPGVNLRHERVPKGVDPGKIDISRFRVKHSLVQRGAEWSDLLFDPQVSAQTTSLAPARGSWGQEP
jgi:hypothetical protein